MDVAPTPSPRDGPVPLGRRRAVLVGSALALATMLAYIPVFGNGFVNYDDDHYITENPNVRLGLSREGILYALTSSRGANWFPLTWLSWMLDYEVYGLEPKGFHLTSLLLHVASVVVLFLVFVRMSGAFWRSAFVAGVFAVHPMHVESVAWAAERKDVLSGLFWVLAMWAYVRYVERPSAGRYLLVPVFLALGLLAKPMLVTLPFALLLLDVWPLERFRRERNEPFDWRRLGRLVIEKLPLFVLVVLSSVITFVVQRAGGAVRPVEALSVGARILNALLSYFRYIQKGFWPTGLSVYYPHPGEDVSLWAALAAGGVLVAVTFGAVWLARHRPYVAVGWLWYLGTLVPVIGLVQVGQQAIADRYTYIPFIGLSVTLAWGLEDLLRRTRVPRVLPATVAAACCLGMAVATSAQVRVWRDSVSLFENALRVTEENALAHINLGVAYLNQGRLEEAEGHLKEAIRIHPGAAEAHTALGALLSRQKKYDEALESFRTALRLAPTLSQAHADLGDMLLDRGDVSQAIVQLREAVNIDPADVVAHTNLGVALIQQGEFDEAIEHFERAVSYEPNHPEAQNNWGVALINLGRSAEAVEHFQRALEARPDYVEALYGLGLAAVAQGDSDEATRHFEKAASLAPEDAEMRYRLGLALAESGHSQEALPHLEKAVSLEPGRAESRYSLGLALADVGRLAEAEEQLRRALSIDPDDARSHYGLGIVLSNGGDIAAAIDQYQKALSKQPDFAPAHNSLGVALASRGRIQEALSHFQRSLSLDPHLVEAHLNAGRSLAQLGRSAEAKEHFLTAASLAPEDPDTHNHLGVFLAQHGDLERAVESFRRALRLRPDDPLARRNLETTLARLQKP